MWDNAYRGNARPPFLINMRPLLGYHDCDRGSVRELLGDWQSHHDDGPEVPQMLEDLFAKNLDLVVCGTAAGRRSAMLQQYYAGQGNKFWRILFQVGLTPRELKPSEYRLLLSFGIGLTDIIKGQSGSDAEIGFRAAGPDVLHERILELTPRCFCFNGKKAAQEFFRRQDVSYGAQSDKVGDTVLFVAPSTSGSGSRWWNPDYWRELADFVKAAV